MQPILKIDLSSGEINSCPIPREWEVNFLGGATLAARILYDDLTIDLNPLAPHAPLLFMNGPLTGTSGPAIGRFVVCGRSPATGLWGESNCGGFWGPELRMAGYDGLWITGKAAEPVYIWIHDNQAEIRPASHLWGLETYATQDKVKTELGMSNVRVAVIGPAGEVQIPYSSILCDHGRVAGRTGMGAVMGSKNLKAVAVKGTGKVPTAKPELFSPLRSQANQTMRSDTITNILRELGTAGSADYFDYLSSMPKMYYQTGVMDGASNISGASMAQSILVGISACHACVIACGRVVRLEDGEKRKGPEYETLVGFGPNLGITDLSEITRLGELCDRFGMDTISLSNTIGFAFYLFQEGLLTEEHTGGLKLIWGNSEAVEKLIHQTVRKDGIGSLIAKGARQLGREVGAEQDAVQVNGLEVAYHDPRGVSGMALVYATSPRGACHNQSDYFMVDIGQTDASLGIKNYSRFAGAEKVHNVARHQDWRTVTNSLVMCLFANIPPDTVVKLVNAACDLDWSLEDLFLCGERGWNLKRVINHRLGLKTENDSLPKAFLKPFLEGPEENCKFTPDFEAMLRAYYIAREWENGCPGRNKLISLGLDWVLPTFQSR